MQLDFISLKLQGFKSFSEKCVLRFADGGLWHVQGINERQPALGPNGAGKSTLWDALTWCLFGRTVKGLRNPDVMPWRGDAKPRVRLAFYVDEAKHVLVRTASPNRLTLDGEACGQETVDALIGMTFELFTQTVVLGQGRTLFMDKTPSEKLELFTGALDLHRWEARSEHAAERARGLDRECVELAASVTHMEQRVSDARHARKAAKQAAREYGDEKHKRLTQAQRQRTALLRRRDQCTKIRDTAALRHDSAGVELKACERELKELRALRQTQIDERSRYQARIEHAEQALETSKQRIEKFERKQICPTCGQRVGKEAHEKHMQEERETKRALLRIVKRGVPSGVTAALADIDAQIKLQSDAAEQFAEKLDKAEAMLSLQRAQVADVEKELAGVNATIAELERDDDAYAKAYEKARADYKAAKQALDDAVQLLAKRNSALQRAKFWIKGFREIRLRIIGDVLGELNMIASAMLDSVGLDGWTMSFEHEHETKAGNVKPGLAVLITSPDSKGPCRWEAWSGGEEQRLRLLATLALSETLLNHAGVVPSIEILDEPTRNMSAEGVRDVISFLSDRARRMRIAVYYVDHAAVESAAFAGALVVAKGKGGSRLISAAPSAADAPAANVGQKAA